VIIVGCAVSNNNDDLLSTEGSPSALGTDDTEQGISSVPSMTNEAKEVVCNSTEIEIVGFTNEVRISDFYWSEDGLYLYFKKGEEWWQYSIKIKAQSRNYYLDTIESQGSSPPTYALVHLSTFDWYDHLLIISPSRTYAIYSQYSNSAGLPIPNERLDNASPEFDSTSDIFLFQEDYSDPIYLGRVYYYSAYAMWSRDENFVFLRMHGAGETREDPYQVYMVDINSQSLIPFLSNEDLHDYKLTGLAISPDEKWVMYRDFYHGGCVALKNIDDFSIRYIFEIQNVTNRGFWWMPDGERIIVTAWDGSEDSIESYSVYLYNLITSEKKVIISDVPSEGGIWGALGVSSNQVWLAIQDDDFSNKKMNNRLYVMELCIDP
jgi:hypothetical protein